MTSSKKPTLLLIDGHSLAFRAFYALSPDSFRTPDGQHTNAVHGFISMMLNILAAEKPTHLAVAFDLSRASFRTEKYPEYKGTRGEIPQEFNGQTELLRMALEAMDITTLTRENYEADDILASLADQGAEAGYIVYVVSGDRDTFQLIQDDVTILYPVKGVLNLARMNDEAVLEKYGIHAKQYPDLAALVGETSDNLPGIPGVGPKTAAKWLQQYGSLTEILANADEIGGKVGESLREHQQLAVRNRRLNHLVRDLKIEKTFDDFKLAAVDEPKVREAFAKLHFKSLLERVLRARGVVPGGKPANAESAGESADAAENMAAVIALARNIDLPVESEPSTTLVKELLTGKATSAWPVFVDGALTQIGLANETLRTNVSTANDSFDSVLSWLTSDTSKTVFDSKNVERSLIALGLGLNSVSLDPLLMGFIDYPLRRSYALEVLAAEYLGIDTTSDTTSDATTDATADSAESSSKWASASASAWLSGQCAQVLESRLISSSQLEVYRSVELPTSHTLAVMESAGISIDTDLLAQLAAELDTEISKTAKACYEIIGKEINLASPKQLQTVLFEDLGMTGTKQVKTGFSTNAEALTTLFEAYGHPFLEKLLLHREISKIRQIIETITKSVEADGRIHTRYVQTGTSTGRLSSENPNLQNIPIRSERGRAIRDAFVVGKGYETLLTADYSQIEMRILAHLSNDAGLIEAFNLGEDLHRYVGSRIYGVEPDEVTSAMRSKVKAMSYGLVYGLSEYGLAKQLRISNGDAKQLMNDYFLRFGGVRRYLAKVVDDAKIEGYTVTSYGRRRPFDDLQSKIFTIRENARRAALNAPIQGTAADIMKIAMTNVDKAIALAGLKSRILLQVHDELLFEVAKGELDTLKTLVQHEMQQAAKLSVPLEVHIGVGKSWDAAGH
jgi:DNA polymerase-1